MSQALISQDGERITFAEILSGQPIEDVKEELYDISLRIDTDQIVYRQLPFLLPVLVVNNEGPLLSRTEMKLRYSNDREGYRKESGKRGVFEETFPFYDLWTEWAAWGARLRDSEGKTVIKKVVAWDAVQSGTPPYMEFPFEDGSDDRRKYVSISSGESLAMIWDLSSLIERAPEGDYELDGVIQRTEYYVGYTTYGNSIRISKLDDEAANIVSKGVSFGSIPEEYQRLKWLLANYDIDFLYKELPADIFSQLAFCAFISEVSRGDDVDESIIGLLDEFPERLLPIAEALRYEFLIGRRLDAYIETLKEQFIEKHPSYAWRINEIEKGNGLIAQARVIRSEFERYRKSQ